MSFIGFRYKAIKICIYTTEGRFSVNISNKYSFFTKKNDVYSR